MYIDCIDIPSSRKFLDDLKVSDTYAIDCGAGVGRVARHLLLPYFKKVDLVEQNPVFVEVARKEIKDERFTESFVSGLQDFRYL
jgi:protein N-terminal methyltransferase